MASGLLDPSAVRELASQLGLRPTKQRGQNFVTDANTVRRIVAAAQVTEDDVVLEVGPGLGSLTLGLLQAARRVIAIEIDDVLAAQLPQTVAARLPERAAALTVINADALRVDAVPEAADSRRCQPSVQRRGAGAVAPAGNVRQLEPRSGHGAGRGG